METDRWDLVHVDLLMVYRRGGTCRHGSLRHRGIGHGAEWIQPCWKNNTKDWKCRDFCLELRKHTSLTVISYKWDGVP